MKRIPITLDLTEIPTELHEFVSGCPVFDSSCSKEARVWYLEREEGLFLKTAPRGTLKNEADMNGFFHSKGLGPEVLSYLSVEKDWLLTRKIPGEDCTHSEYLSDPKRLCDSTASILRRLHDMDASGCPITDRNERYLALAEKHYRLGKFDRELFSGRCGFASAEEAWKEVEINGKYLKPDALLHGDYCLPNVMLDNWRFSGFIDLGNGGIGDRHIDIFWGVWTLFFNLKTNAYYDRFLDVYGRDQIIPEQLRTIAAFEVFG